MGGLAFTVLYVLHRVGQWPGPDNSSTTAVADYQVSHRGVLLASEIAVGLALLAFIAVLAGLVPVVWQAGQQPVAVAVLVSGILFIAMGFVSTAAETALVNVGDSNQPAAVLALNQLQGRVPVVFAITSLTASISWAILRTGLLWRWLGIAGMVAAAVFLLGSVFSPLGSTPEENSSLFRYRAVHRVDAAAQRRTVARRRHTIVSGAGCGGHGARPATVPGRGRKPDRVTLSCRWDHGVRDDAHRAVPARRGRYPSSRGHDGDMRLVSLLRTRPGRDIGCRPASAARGGGVRGPGRPRGRRGCVRG